MVYALGSYPVLHVCDILYLSANYTNEYRLVNDKDKYEGRFEIRLINGSCGNAVGINWNFKAVSIACQVLVHSPLVLFIGLLEESCRFRYQQRQVVAGFGCKVIICECSASMKESFKGR